MIEGKFTFLLGFNRGCLLNIWSSNSSHKYFFLCLPKILNLKLSHLCNILLSSLPQGWSFSMTLYQIYFLFFPYLFLEWRYCIFLNYLILVLAMKKILAWDYFIFKVVLLFYWKVKDIKLIFLIKTNKISIIKTGVNSIPSNNYL